MSHAPPWHPGTVPARVARGVVLGVLGLALGGCGDGPEGQELTNRELTTLAPGATVSTPAANARTAARDEPGLVAMRAARARVPRGTVTELERRSEGWEVTLVRRDGREVVVGVGPGDPPLVRRLGVDAADGDDDLLLVELKRLGVGQALARARTVVPTAVLAKIELDLDDGALQYELDFDDEDDVLVDARTGAISRED